MAIKMVLLFYYFFVDYLMGGDIKPNARAVSASELSSRNVNGFIGWLLCARAPARITLATDAVNDRRGRGGGLQG